MVFFASKQDSLIMLFCFFTQMHYPLIYSI